MHQVKANSLYMLIPNSINISEQQGLKFQLWPKQLPM